MAAAPRGHPALRGPSFAAAPRCLQLDAEDRDQLLLIHAQHGSDSLGAGTLELDLAFLLLDTGEIGPARSYAEHAVAIFGKVLGPAHPDLAMALEALATAELRSKRPERAVAALERAVAIRAGATGTAPNDLAATRFDLAKAIIAARGSVAPGRVSSPRTHATRSRASAMPMVSARSPPGSRRTGDPLGRRRSNAPVSGAARPCRDSVRAGARARTRVARLLVRVLAAVWVEAGGDSWPGGGDSLMSGFVPMQRYAAARCALGDARGPLYRIAMVAGATLLHPDVTPSVLVVDDDPSVREYFDDVLRLEGFAVTTLADPRRAVERIRRDVFHILVIDLMMPDIDGLSLIAQIRAFDHHTPIILVSGFADFETVSAAIDLGISAYLDHPITVAELRDTLAHIMNRHGFASRDEHDLRGAIGQRIERARTARGLTLTQVASRIDLTAARLSRIERGETDASVSYLYKIAAVLNVPLTRLLAGY